MANPEQISILRQGPFVWNEWRSKQETDFPVDLVGADLKGLHLNGVNFKKADLRKADLSSARLPAANFADAELIETSFIRADLSRARFSNARLSWANFSYAELTASNFTGASLINVNFSGARISGSNFTNAGIGATVFIENDLSKVKGLEKVRHHGPSGIGVDTIYASGGAIPEVFLRGAGVPDNLIAYSGSLVGKPIQFYSCFISYSTKDQAFADRLYADLQSNGVRCWFAPHDIEPGKKVHEQIDEAIRLHERLLLILSRASIASEWVKTEIAKARKREVNEQRRVLFPLRLIDFESLRDWECFDADTGKDSAREIREYFIPDFSHWKDHDSYQNAFKRLIRAMKAEVPSS